MHIIPRAPQPARAAAGPAPSFRQVSLPGNVSMRQTAPKFGHCGLEGLIGPLLSSVIGFTVVPLVKLAAPAVYQRLDLGNPDSPSRQRFEKRVQVFSPAALGLAAALYTFGPLQATLDGIKPERVSQGFQALYYGQDAIKYLGLDVSVPESDRAAFLAVAREKFPADALLREELHAGRLSHKKFMELMDASPGLKARVQAAPQQYPVHISETATANYRAIQQLMAKLVAARLTDEELARTVRELPIGELERDRLQALVAESVKAVEKGPFLATGGVKQFDEVFLKAARAFPESFTAEQTAVLKQTAQAVVADYQALDRKEADTQNLMDILKITAFSLMAATVAQLPVDEVLGRLLNRVRRRKKPG